MVVCYDYYDCLQCFGYKRNPNNKTYAGGFKLRELRDKFEIWSLYVESRYRHKGYGTEMLTEFLSQYTSNKPLYLYVYKDNTIAIRLYEKVGFTIVGDYSPYAYRMKYKRS